jgi:ribose-phosphate pyrophosphokinase
MTILFALPLYETMARALGQRLAIPRGRFSVGRFANEEIHVSLETGVAGHDCVVLGTVAPPDEQMLATFLLCHTLKKEGARTVRALLPYLGYARHDRPEPGRSLAAAWVGALARASGIDAVVTVDVHSGAVPRLFPIPLLSLSSAAVFAEELGRLSPADLTVVAPDEGARERCEAARQAAGIRRPLAWFSKERSPTGVTHSALQGAVGPRVVIVDDILDTGGTLVSACEALAQAGVREITIMVTHGLFTGRAWERLRSLGVARIYCTDTVPLPARLEASSVGVLSVVPLVAESLVSPGAPPPPRPL